MESRRTAQAFCVLTCLLFALLGPTRAGAQWWDLDEHVGDAVVEKTSDKLELHFDLRMRYEARDGVNFGAKPDAGGLLGRTRVGMAYKPTKWLKFSGMMEHMWSPGFGDASSASTRGTPDLQEGYVELFHSQEDGIGMTVGRKMLKYGDGRLINTPSWGNFNKSFDHARLYYRTPHVKLELLFLSQVKARENEFNRPNLGDRLWGVYNVFPNLFGNNLMEVYALRRTLNRTAGFKGGSQADGTDRLGINAYGARMAGPMSASVKYTVEGVYQRGKIGPSQHRAFGWVTNVTKGWKAGGKKIDLTGEYKYASGTSDPDNSSRHGTFDTFYASNHNRFGHQDLFGWSNIHNAQALTKIGLTSRLALNVMYNSSWLARGRDALYTNSGKVIAQDGTGAAGRHVGQELDAYFTYKYKVFQIGAGYGYMFKGDFIRNTTPGVNPNYIYLFHTYSF